MVALPSNPFLQQENLPHFETVQAEHLTPAITDILSTLASDFKKLEESLGERKEDVSFDDVLPVLERLQFPLEFAWGIAGHLNGVKNSDDLRAAYEENQPKIVEASSAISQSQTLYKALVAIQKKLPQEDMSFEATQKRRAVELTLRGMTLGGVGLEGEAKERFNQIKMRLAALKTSFSNHVLDATKAYSTTVTDVSKLKGVPDSAMALWAAAYSKDHEDQPAATPEAGPWKITLDMPSYIAVLSHVPDRALREQVYRAYITKASSGDQDNVPLIYEILQLKQEMASLLGFENYAQQSLASKMAPSIESVKDLSNLICAKALPAAQKEMKEMLALARQTDATVTKLEPWDMSFYKERLKESKFELTEEETRPYFALPAVLEGMFSLVSRIFNVQVKAADGKTQVWHEDVRFFEIFDGTTEKQIASFFLDPYSRPSNKRGGAWMGTCVGKSSACQRDIATAYLTCNGSPPVGDKPSLMTFREVETLFHEFGHGLQHMLTKATVGDVAGINGVEWDAVELPSQFMENWCYDRPTVYGFAKHWETGEPMPETMFQKLCEQKTFNAGMMACRQLLFGQLDLELHSNYDATKGRSGEGESVFDVQRRIASKFTPYSMPLEEDRFLCSFSHIFAGGYAAGYYSYKWAEVMSADAFSAFEDAGLDNEEQVKQVGLKFRETVLELGGGVDPMTVFKTFRGHEPNPDALLRHNGLAQ